VGRPVAAIALAVTGLRFVTYNLFERAPLRCKPAGKGRGNPSAPALSRIGRSS
jgi:hypothetical protein